MNLAGFEKIAPHLSSPLILVGFVMMLAYGIHRQLMKSGQLTQVSKKDSGIIIQLILRYGFWLALTLLVVGLGMAGWNKYADRVDRVDASKRAAKTVEPPHEQQKIKHKQNNFQAIQRKALELNPDDTERWNELGLLLLQTGEFVQAEETFQKALALGEAHQDKKAQAMAYANLGLLYRIRDNIDQAEAYWKKSLTLYHEMGMPDAKDIQQWLDELLQHRIRQQTSSVDN